MNRPAGPWRSVAWARRLLVLPFLAGLALFGAAPAPSQGGREVKPDYQVKAEYLFVFTKYVEWPAGALSKPDQPIVIGVLGDEAIADALERHAKGRVSQGGRKVAVLRSRRSADLGGCHVVFVGQGERRNLREIAEAIRDKPALTVCDTDALFSQGLMIKFVMQEDSVRFEVKLEPVERAGLSIQSGMLDSAKKVWRKTGAGPAIP